MQHRSVAPLAALFLVVSAARAQSPFTEFANVNSANAQVGGNVFIPVDFSSNGRFCAFIVDAQLAPQDTNFTADAYVRDVDADVTLYVGPNGGPSANGAPADIAISGTGRYVVWSTHASNLGPVDTNNRTDVYRKDMTTGVVTLVSAGAGGAGSNGFCNSPAVSDNGRFVAYRTTASDLAPGHSGLDWQIVVTDLNTGLSQLVSTSSAGVEGNRESAYTDISADGRYVSFYSRSNNLVTPDTNNFGGDVFRKDLLTGQLRRASEDANGAQAAYTAHWNEFSSISADGRHVSFMSASNQIVAGTSNPWGEIYVRHLSLGQTERMCLSPSNGEPDQRTEFSALSGNGRRVAMISYASNIVLPDNSPGAPDVIVRDRGAPQSPTVYCVASQNSLGCTPTLSYSGTPAASLMSGFTLTANNLLNQKAGTLFYSVLGPNNTPFSGGWLCVLPPLRRTPVSSTNGSPVQVNDCSGFITRDFNTWIQTGGDPLLVAGQEVWAQYYSRDPGFAPPNNVNLTEAIDFLILP